MPDLTRTHRRLFLACCGYAAGGALPFLANYANAGEISLLAGLLGVVTVGAWRGRDTAGKRRRQLTSVFERWRPHRNATEKLREQHPMQDTIRQPQKPAGAPVRSVRALAEAEISLINKMLAAHSIQAKTGIKLTMCVQSSFIVYGLRVAPGENVRKIEAISRELSNELTRQRVRLLPGYHGRAVVRLRDYPLAVEVPHPAPVPLSWQSANLRAGAGVALVGRSYSYTGAREEYLDLERHYHTLVAAMSGGGKSTLMRMALLTLAYNTPPDDLRIMLVDLKNDDLTVFRDLPHCISYAGDIESAAEAIEQVHEIKTERIASQEKPYRLLLIIDELAELGAAKNALKQLGSILSTGRSLGINVLAGTQYPTAATIGSVVNASFTVRLVGMVDGKTAAHTATKRAGSGAELLQTPGDFLRVDGQELVRMKAYDLSQDDTAVEVKKIVDKLPGVRFVLPDASPRQDEIGTLADKIHDLWIQDASKNAMAKYAFGRPYAGSYAGKIDMAIQRLIDRGSTTTD